MELIYEADNTRPQDITMGEKRILLLVGNSLARQSIFTTETSCIDLAPELTVSNNGIYVIVGCSVPLILRPVGDCHTR